MNYGLPLVAENVEIISIPDSGHYLFEEQPEKVLAVILPFLKS